MFKEDINKALKECGIDDLVIEDILKDTNDSLKKLMELELRQKIKADELRVEIFKHIQNLDESELECFKERLKTMDLKAWKVKGEKK